MSEFGSHRSQGQALIKEQGIFAVVKPTRTGGTLNPVIACIENKKKAVIVTHSNDLTVDIKRQLNKILGYAPKILIIPDNTRLCRKLDRRLKLKFQLRKNCKNCEYNGKPSHCLYQRLLLEEADVYITTYAKLEVMQKTRSKLLKLVYSCKVGILDEDSTRILSSPQAIGLVNIEQSEIRKVSDLLRQQFPEEWQRYEEMMRTMSYIHNKRDWIFVKFWFTLETTVCRIETIFQPGKHQNRIDDALEDSDFPNFWRYITRLTEQDEDTALLQEVFPLMLTRDVFITIKNDEVFAAPIEDTLVHLREFCKAFENGTVLLVDACHLELNYAAIFGREVTPKVWLDPNRTDESQLVVCDRYHSAVKFFVGNRAVQDRFENVIRSFNFDPDETLIVTLNKTTPKIVERWNAGETTWHRSSRTRGIQAEDRFKMFLMLGPYVQTNSFDALACSWPGDYFLESFEGLAEEQKNTVKSQILKRNNEIGELVNCLGRVKDPTGRKRSLVVCLGMTKIDVEKFLKQKMSPAWPSITRTKCVQPVLKGGLSKDGPWIARLWLDKANVDVEDFPLIARIIHYTKQKRKCAPSQVLFGQTTLIRTIAMKHQQILEAYGVKLIFQTGGLSLEAR
jgi:hypothetical protein